MSGILMLNADFTPLRVVTIARGVGLVLANKAEIIEESDEPLRSEKIWQNMPSVIKLKYWVKIPFRSKIPLNRKALTARDKGLCQMITISGPCERVGTTIDHVIPKSKGGIHIWENVVLCCKKCNGKKADFTLEELGWSLKAKPKAPRTVTWFYVGISPNLEASWEPYLQMA